MTKLFHVCRTTIEVFQEDVMVNYIEAADMSNHPRSVNTPFSAVKSASEIIVKTAVSVELCCRFDDWYLGCFPPEI